MNSSCRQMKKKKARKLRVRFTFILFVLGLLVSGGCGMYRSARDWRIFSVSEIVVRGVAEEYVTRVADASGIRRGSSMLELNSREITRRLESLDFVRKAHIRRRPPGRVVLDISGRKPFALVNGSVVVGDDGREVSSDVKGLDLPDVECPLRKGKGGLKSVDPELLQQAFLALAVVKSFGVKRVNVTRLDGVRVLLTDGTLLRLGSGRFGEKSKMIALVLRDLKERERKVSTIDARFDSQILVLKQKSLRSRKN
jgi:cell division protein FtsQ